MPELEGAFLVRLSGSRKKDNSQDFSNITITGITPGY